MSAYPGDLKPERQTSKLNALIDVGIDTFVCLQPKDELTRFVAYGPELIQLHEQRTQSDASTSAVSGRSKLSFLSFPIVDNFVAEDAEVNAFTDQVIDLFHQGHKILIHCWGGHGRTGTISAIIYGKLYRLPSQEALKRVGIYHKCREISKSVAPTTPQQIDQVHQILSVKT